MTPRHIKDHDYKCCQCGGKPVRWNHPTKVYGICMQCDLVFFL